MRFPSRVSRRSIRNTLAVYQAMHDNTAPVIEQAAVKPRAKQKAPERDVMDAIRKWARLRGITLFRNNTGQYEAAPGRWVRFGLTVGSSDLIGYRVHNGVAQFCAFECKAAGKNATPEQQQFIDDVRAAGGIAGVVRNVDEAEALLRD